MVSCSLRHATGHCGSPHRPPGEPPTDAECESCLYRIVPLDVGVKRAIDLPRLTVAIPVRPVSCPQTSKLCVVTIAVGDTGRELHALSGPSQRKYAARVGADYVVIEDKSQEWPLSEKFRVRNVARQYERTLYLDSDVAILPDAPNIFDAVPVGGIGLFKLPGSWWRKSGEWSASELREVCTSQGAEPHPGALECHYNSGVWVGDREHADYWTAPEKPFDSSKWCAEEHWCRNTLFQRGWPVHELDWKWNWQYYLDPEYVEKWPQGAWFAHVAGQGVDKLRQLRRVLDIQEPLGPGTVLHTILADEFAYPAQSWCGCAAYAAQMDAWGVDGCRERLDEIVKHLSIEADRFGVASAMGARNVTMRVAVELAIARAAGETDGLRAVWVKSAGLIARWFPSLTQHHVAS